jgi:hypothetical protein
VTYNNVGIHALLLLHVDKSGVKLYDALVVVVGVKLFYADATCSSVINVTRSCATNVLLDVCQTFAQPFATAKNMFRKVLITMFTPKERLESSA